MPQVPQDNNYVAPGQAPAMIQRVGAGPDAFGAQVGQATQGLGQATQGAVGTGLGIATEQAALDNRTNAEDIYNKQVDARITSVLHDPNSGYYTMQGKDALDAYQPTVDAINRIRDDAINNAANPAQQRLLADLAGRRIDMELGSMGAYADQQRKGFQAATSQGIIDGAANSAANNFNDSDRYGVALSTAAQQASDRAQQLGLTGDAAQPLIDRSVAQVQQARYFAMAQQDPVAALKAWQDDPHKLGGLAGADIGERLQKLAEPMQDHQIAMQIVGGHAMPATGLAQAVMQQESGGKDFSGDGSPVTSAKGALFSMQVMPATAADPGFGVRPAAAQTPEEYNRVGSDLLQTMVGRYQGNQTLALAAYNAGPGAVDAAIRQYGDPNQGQISNADFLSHMPGETQHYVSSINAAAPPREGVVPVNLNAKANEGQQLALAQSATTDPVRNERIAAMVQQYNNQIAVGQQQQEKASLDTLLPSLTGINNTPQATTMSDLLADPDRRAAYGNLSPEQQIKVTDMVTANARPEKQVVTPEDRDNYLAVHGLAFTDPEKFASLKMTDPEIADLPVPLQNQVMTEKANFDKQQASLAGQQIRLTQALGNVKDITTNAQLVPNGKTPEQTQNWNRYVGAFSQQLEQVHQETGKMPNVQEQRQIAANLVLNVHTANTGFFGRHFGTTTDMPAYQAMSPDADGNTVANDRITYDVPQAFATNAAAAYQAKHGRPPGDEIVQQLYKMSLTPGAN